MASLELSQEGGEFLTRLRAYLGEYGKRSDTIIELADPSWIEDPTIAINNLKAYLSDDAEDPQTHWNQLVVEREQFVADARERLAGYPEAVRGQFEMFMMAGQDGQRIQEDHNWWIDQMGNHQLRHVYLEAGRRLVAAGAIAEANDVFHWPVVGTLRVDVEDVPEAMAHPFRGHGRILERAQYVCRFVRESVWSRRSA